MYKRRIFQNKDGVVTSLISYEDYYARLSALNGNGKNQDSVIGFVGASNDKPRLY